MNAAADSKRARPVPRVPSGSKAEKYRLVTIDAYLRDLEASKPDSKYDWTVKQAENPQGDLTLDLVIYRSKNTKIEGNQGNQGNHGDRDMMSSRRRQQDDGGGTCDMRNVAYRGLLGKYDLCSNLYFVLFEQRGIKCLLEFFM